MVFCMRPDGGAVVLGNPPPFGAGGAWPPLESSPVIITSAMFYVAPRPGQAGGEYRTTLVRRSAPTAAKVAVGVTVPIVGVGMLGYSAIKKIMKKTKSGDVGQVREIVYSQAWGRDDPIVQLPPGAAHEHGYSMTWGISETQTRELAQSLGLKLGKTGALTGELSSKFGIATTISEQRSVTDTVKLSNDGTRTYRLYARWFVRHEITVHRLESPDGQDQPRTWEDWQEALTGAIEPYKRSLLCKVTFMSPGNVVLTYCEVEN